VGSDPVSSSYPKVETLAVYAGDSSFVSAFVHVLKTLRNILWWELIATVEAFVSV